MPRDLLAKAAVQVVDPQGFEEMSRVLENALMEVERIAEESRDRQEADHSQGQIEMMVAVCSFAASLPKPPDNGTGPSADAS
jgi:hypothetical protein